MLGLGLLLVAPRARADLTVRWDCYLPNSGVDCAVLESSLTSKIPFLRVVPSGADADVVVTLTSVPAEGATRFRLDCVGKPLDGRATETHTTDKIPSNIDATTATVRLLTKLERGLDDFMDQRLVAEVKDSGLDIHVSDPVRLPFTGRQEQTSVKWYVAPTVGAYFSDVEGVGVNASGSAAVGFNYSEQAWRLQQSIGANYSRQSQPVPGTSETASIQFGGGNATNVVSWALSRDSRWNLGLLVSAEKNPQANYRFRANASVGLEFDLVPRQTVNQQNLGFRCAVGPEFQHYDVANVEGLNTKSIGRQFCDVFLSWHFEPVDVAGSLGETSLLGDFAYRSFSASLSATWRLTDNLMLSPWIYVQEINEAINEAQPTTAVYNDPRQEIEASMLAAVQQGYTAPFGVQSGLSLRYVFGNGSLSIEDQRWKGTSNLR
jgi:hypothetical protein